MEATKAFVVRRVADLAHVSTSITVAYFASVTFGVVAFVATAVPRFIRTRTGKVLVASLNASLLQRMNKRRLGEAKAALYAEALFASALGMESASAPEAPPPKKVKTKKSHGRKKKRKKTR